MYGEGRGAYRFWCGDLKERDHLVDLGVDERIILTGNFKKWDGARTGLIWLRIGHVDGCCECDNEPLGSVPCENFMTS